MSRVLLQVLKVASVFLHAGVVIGGGDDVKGGGRKVECRFFFPNLLVIVQKTQETSINIFV